MKKSNMIWAAIFLSPPLFVYIAIVIYPLLTSFYYSVTDWNGFNIDYNLIGFENYGKMFTDPNFSNAITNTIIWTIAAILLPTVGGLTLALALHGSKFLARLYKSLFYLPICLSLVVIGQVWIWIYQPDWGLINITLEALGREDQTQAWLARPEFALYAVIFAWVWQQTALSMVIFLAGLTAVPQELLEAAQIDGATYWQVARRVTIPLLAPASVVVIALAVINSLKSFDVLYIMTRGGPFHSSDNLAMFMYNEAFQKYNMGYSSAIAVVLFLITLVVIGIYFRQSANLENLYD